MRHITNRSYVFSKCNDKIDVAPSTCFFCCFCFCIGPEKPEDIMITARGTDSLSIRWTLPEGRADHYVITISDISLMNLNSTTTTVTTALFTDLYPGRVFVITVTAVAGNFTSGSDQSLFATCKFNILYCCSFHDAVLIRSIRFFFLMGLSH